MGIARAPTTALNGAPRVGLLPVEVSTFIGRRRDLKYLVKLQAATRVLTIVGPGGSGKTRLAIRVARQRQAEIPGGVWFVDMVQEFRPMNPTDVLADMLEDGLEPRLVVVDTCDADIRGSASVIEQLLMHNPALQVLATSREPLGITHEVVWHIPLLAVPDEQTTAHHRLQATDACQLFISRALAAVPDDPADEAYSRALARICRNLDGLPLAIELAAMHPGNVGMAGLAFRSTTPFILGLPGRRDAPARHRSLRALMDWSYARLGAREQLALRRVSVFSGDWTLDMAGVVCPEIARSELATAIATLQTKSLVQSSRRDGSTRFEVLEIVRQYGRELLRDSGELQQACRKHLEWCVALAESDPPERLNQQHGQRLERELAEITAALEFAQDSGETELGLRLTAAAFPLWYLRGRLTHGYDTMRRFLQQPLDSVKPEVIERARMWNTQLIIQRGEYVQAESDLRDQPSTASDPEAPSGPLRLVLLGNVMLWSGQLERAAKFYDDAERLAAEGSASLPMAIYQSARAALEQGDLERARAQAQRLLHLPNSRGSVLAARANQIEALVDAESGDAASALRHLHEAERLLRRMDDVMGFIDLLTDRARVYMQAGQNSVAHPAFVNAAGLADLVGARVRLVRAIEGIACVIADSQPGLCVLLAASACASRAAMHAIAWPHDTARLATALSVARRHATRWLDAATTGLGSATYAQAWQLGGLLLESETARIALATLQSDPPLAISDIPPSLTGREWEVAQLFATGASTRQIADRLTLSRDTVRTHLDRATAKLGLHSRVQLAMWVARSRVADPV
jgi:predicted ATPase/DNA-binding CsgD family transcriptional regulator